MKICLFDWNAGGHHNVWVQAFADALASKAEVVAAVPDPVIEELDLSALEVHSLGEPRPRAGTGPGLDKATLARSEIALLEEAVSITQPDHVIVLYADPVLRWLAGTRQFPCKVSIIVMFATAQLPGSYGLPLTPKERGQALVKEFSLWRWRRRRDAHVLFGVDAEAVKRWTRESGRGAAARWLAEPPLKAIPPPIPPEERDGCFMFGYLDERKGFDRLALALGQGCEGLKLTIFGAVAPEFRDQLTEHLEELRSGGVQINADLRRVPYAVAMTQMSRSRCALLSFGWRKSPWSRVLIEAAAMRTPVVIGGENVPTRLVARYGLGRTPDPNDPAAIREAVLELAMDPTAPGRYEKCLRQFAEDVHGDRFVTAVHDAFELN